MKTKHVLFSSVPVLLSFFSATAQQTPSQKDITIEAGRIVVAPKGLAAVSFIRFDTLKLRAAELPEQQNKSKRRKRDQSFTTYTIEDKNCVRLDCTVGHSKIQLRHLDNIIINERN